LLFEMNPSTGALSRRDFFPHSSNPAWLAIPPSGACLYAANGGGSFQGRRTGSLSGFAIDHSSGRLTKLNDAASEGTGPAHLSIHPSGKYVFAANYSGGNFAVLPILPDGQLGAATDSRKGEGTPGPEHAASALLGSLAISDHESAHGHMVQADPSGRYVLGADLGLDQILIWKFDMESGKLAPNDPPSVSLPPGDGPRHFAFHPSGRWLYSIQEEGSTVALFDYDAAHGHLTHRQTVSSLPRGFTGTNFTSEIMVSADGKFVYGANRLHDSIAFFSVAGNGELTLVDEAWTRGDYPCTLAFDPSGNFLYSCNQKSDAVTTFRVDRGTGGLTFTGQYTPAGAPASIVFFTL
jgi:6-phosphogluconolactonase (cycloisomerase 2 family)